ncbi:MAG TPA: hypothetical protein VMR44_02860 [Thermoanaerobaculia bacterium]|nr:hypothetical protein [Thermoanaerobaculia bacterium]
MTGRAALAIAGAAALAACATGVRAVSPPEPAGRGGRPTVLVVGLETTLEEEAWRERRLGMGLRGRLSQMLADSGAFETLEERELAPSVREAVGGYWLRERGSAEEPSGDAGLDRWHEATGAEWIAHGSLDSMGVTRDRVSGVAGGRRWAYRASVRLCLHRQGAPSLCREGTGRSVTRVMSAGVQYRGDEVAFDQAGPAQAVDRALVDAFDRLMPEWESGR